MGIEEILKNADFDRVINALSVDTREGRNARSYRGEYKGERIRRPTSIGLRKDKHIEVYSETLKNPDGTPARIEDDVVRVARIHTNFPKKVVRTDTAMLFGGTMHVKAMNQDESFERFKTMWTRVLGMQSVLIEFSEKLMSETKAAIVFYPITHHPWWSENEQGETQLNCKVLSLPQSNEVRSEFYPHFDGGRMDAFLHLYDAKTGDTTKECATLWTRKEIITAEKAEGVWHVKKEKNLFNLIPVVYGDIEEPEWDESAIVMDAHEMRLSRLADTNDYFSEPTIVTYGEANLPGKNTMGKEIQFPIKVDSDSGKEYHGDARVMAWDQSIASTEKELNETKNEMNSGVSMPDLSFENLKGIGNMSGVSRRFMLLDAEIKKLFNQRVFMPALNRCITIVTAGIANITDINLKDALKNNWISVEFDSIIPRDALEQAQILQIAGGGAAFNSQETIVAHSPLTAQGDVENEMLRIKKDVTNVMTTGGVVV